MNKEDYRLDQIRDRVRQVMYVGLRNWLP